MTSIEQIKALWDKMTQKERFKLLLEWKDLYCMNCGEKKSKSSMMQGRCVCDPYWDDFT